MAAQPFTFHHFLEAFWYDGLLAIAVSDPSRPNVKYFEKGAELDIPTDTNVFFGPAMRSSQGEKKEDILGTAALWVDADDPQRPLYTLPPSIIVRSGGGYHLYWLLQEPITDTSQLEDLNKLLVEDIPTADKAAWNCNRVLRVPSTINTKYNPPAPVTLEVWNPEVRYTPDDIGALANLDSKTKHKIRTGDRRGYRSRSERDWAIIMKLIAAGATDELIRLIYDRQPCGDKHKENAHYLPQTLAKARKSYVEAKPQGDQKQDVPVFTHDEEGYYLVSKRGAKKLSTFVIEPTVLLDGSQFEAEDAIVCNVHAASYVWAGKVFSRSAFTSVRRFDTEAPVAAWQWLGRDDDIRHLLPYLLEQLRAQGLPKVGATSVLGLHNINGQWMFLGDKEVITAEETFTGYAGPLCWLPSRKEHPELDLIARVNSEEIDWLGKMLPQLNEPETIWPMIGWYAAACLKPWLEQHHYRFPILNVVGTRGSGKTTLIQRVFLGLFGQTDPKTYDAGTTRFVTLALLGATNAVPIAFSEFRYEFVERLLRTVLLAYDTGHDPRGRGDQTTVDYPLSAPFSIDGEDLVSDPAARERLIVAHLHPDTIAEGSECYTTFQTLREHMPAGFAGYYITKVLQDLPDLDKILEEARAKVFTAYPMGLPDRVRNNHVVAYFGIMLWCKYTNSPLPDPEVLMSSITSVFNLAAGRAATLADVMVEDLVNAVAQGSSYFNTAYDMEQNVLWFQLSPAHTWWVVSRRRTGRGALERDAIKAQLIEAPYSVVPKAVSDSWMYGIDLQLAVDSGLDIPSRIPERVFTVRF